MTNHHPTNQPIITKGRAIEFAEYFHTAFPDRANPSDHDGWGKDVMNILTGSDGSLFGDIALYDPMRVVFAELAGDTQTQQLVTDQFIARFQSPLYQSTFLLDAQNRLLTADHPEFEAAYHDPDRTKPAIMAERAKTFLNQQCDGLFNTCYDVYTTLGKTVPTGETLRNLRLSMNAETNTIELRPANPLEQIADATLGRIRDARSGSLRNHDQETIHSGEGNTANRYDALANWLVDQPVFRPIATKIAECYSSFMMPDADQNHSTILMKWRENKQKKSLERAFNKP